MRSSILTILLFSTVVLAYNAADYMPLRIGNFWTYRDSTEEGTTTSYNEVVGIEMISGYETFLMREWDAENDDTSFMQFREDGLYNLISFDEEGAADIPLRVLADPFNIGDSWVALDFDSSWVDGFMTCYISLEITVSVLRLENVVVPAGVFNNTVVVHLEGFQDVTVTFMADTYDTWSGIAMENDMWLARNFGPVKTHEATYIDTTETWSELVSFNSNIFEAPHKPESHKIGVSPNPFNSACKIQLPLGATRATIVDLDGREITTLDTEAGKTIWAPTTVSSGLYFVKTIIGDKIYTERVFYLK